MVLAVHLCPEIACFSEDTPMQKNLEEVVIQLGGEALLGDQRPVVCHSLLNMQ